MAIAPSARSPRLRAVPLILALLVPTTVIVPIAAAGEPRPSSPAKPPAPKDSDKSEGEGSTEKSDKYDPENITAISQYMETVVKGTSLFQAKDNTGAIDTYRKAIQLNPKSPLAYMLLSEVYLLSGNMGEAEAAIQQAYDAESKNPLLRSHVLFVRADLFERQKKWEQAKAAWQAYTEYAAKLGVDGGAFPQSGAERLKALQKVLEMEKAYVAVRERIAANKAAASATASAKPPAKPPAKK